MKKSPSPKNLIIVVFGTFFGLISVQNSLGQNVGIGTSSPTAKLHIIGNVRFEGIQGDNLFKRIAVLDEQGYLFWKNQDSVLNNVWFLNGNTANSNQFIGTVNNQRLIFKTFGKEQVTILQNGNVGIGTSNPDRKLVLYNTLTGFNNEIVIKQGPMSSLGAFLVLDNTANTGGKYWSIGSSGLLNTSGELGAVGSLEFYQFDAGPDERVRMIITPQGNVGIHTIPSSRFHVNGSVRFENLPSGSGQALVIGPDGQVYKSESFLNSVETYIPTETQVQIDELNAKVEELESIINKMQEEINLLK